ncbi:MAG TPA: hypothetical protein VG276_13440 [Actinomycetes bacterium]|jgi:hypothetical protein|nr:hypothetical protein [Actinomycetes bacterium]
MNVILAHVMLEAGAAAPKVLDRLCDCLGGAPRHRALDLPARAARAPPNQRTIHQ